MTEETQVDETESFEVVTTDAVELEKAQEAKQEESAASETDKDDNEGDQDDKKPAASDTGEEATAKKGNGRFQKRIDRLTKRAAEAERKLQEAERKLQDKEGDKGGKAEPETQSDGEPDPSEFDTYDEYLDALSSWKAEGKTKPEKKKDDKTEADSDDGDRSNDDPEFSDALDDVQDAFSDTRSKYDDFDTVVIEAKDLQISREMVIAMSEAEEPGEIAYHLGKNKEEAARIAKLSPIAQAREIGKLEVKLASKPKQPSKKKTTEAPDPIDPVSGSDSSKKSVKDMDFAEYERTRNEQERGKKSFW